jgi:hypothetical protein
MFVIHTAFYPQTARQLSTDVAGYQNPFSRMGSGEKT